MAGKNVRSALSDALADLTTENLKRFGRELLSRPQGPRIARNKVDGKDYMDIADVVVSAFTEKGAVEVAVEILKKIGCSEEAKRLVEDTVGSRPVLPPPIADEEAGGQTDDMHFVDKYQRELIQRVSNIEPILDDLLFENVIKQEAYDKIIATPTCQDKMRKLYAGPLKAGEACKEIFYAILQKHEEYLIKDLKGN